MTGADKSTEITQLDEEDVHSLTDGLRGMTVLPDGTDYDDARDVWNGLVDKHPALIVKCAGAADVSTALSFARDHDVPISIRGGGHHQAGSAIAEDGLVIDLSEMTSVRIDPREQVARVDPGARVRDVLIEAQHYGLATPTGSAGDVGIPGSTLGGGIGWIRRQHGLGIDALRAVDIVTPDGDLRRASPEQNPDLFWALRGGGGNFGIVTSFEFELYEVGPIVPALGTFYPGDEAESVLDAYHDLTQEASSELTTLALDGHVPNLPPIPDEVAGQEAIAIMGCYAGDSDIGMEAIQPFREITEPLLDMSEPMPYLMLHQLGTMMFPEGRNYCHRSVFVDDLSQGVIDRIVEHASDAPSPLSGVGIWHLGGAIRDVDSETTAFPWRDKEYMITVEANWEGGDDEANIAWAQAGDTAFRELGGEGAYGGFTGVSEQADEDVVERVYGQNAARLAEVKSEYDPTNVFSKNVNVTPTDD